MNSSVICAMNTHLCTTLRSKNIFISASFKKNRVSLISYAECTANSASSLAVLQWYPAWRLLRMPRCLQSQSRACTSWPSMFSLSLFLFAITLGVRRGDGCNDTGEFVCMPSLTHFSLSCRIPLRQSFLSCTSQQTLMRCPISPPYQYMDCPVLRRSISSDSILMAAPKLPPTTLLVVRLQHLQPLVLDSGQGPH
jgi:hypothetical protein